MRLSDEQQTYSQTCICILNIIRHTRNQYRDLRKIGYDSMRLFLQTHL